MEVTGLFDELSPPYASVVVDPPWHYDEVPCNGLDPSGDSVGSKPLPYSTMTLDEIAALPVGDLGTDCRLFLWTTNRYLRAAFDICDAWGFAYRQTLVWHKQNLFMPASVAPNAEFALVAVKGRPPRIGTASSAVVSTNENHAVRLHSQKPAAFFDLVERVSPGPYVELFARSPRFGWDSWGYGYETAVHA